MIGIVLFLLLRYPQSLLQTFEPLPVGLRVTVVHRVYQTSLPTDLVHLGRRHDLMEAVVVRKQRLARVAVQIVELGLFVPLEDVDLRLDLRLLRRRSKRCRAVLRKRAPDHSRIHLIAEEEQALEPNPFRVVLVRAAVAFPSIGLLQFVAEIVTQMLPL